MMSIEATLTRKYGITFIDARSVANEARLALDIQGYPSDDQRDLILREACRVFRRKSRPEVAAMLIRRESLDESIRSSSSEFYDSSGRGGDDMSSTSSSSKRAFRLFGRRASKAGY